MSVKIYKPGGTIIAEEAGQNTLSFTPVLNDLWVSGNQVGFTDSGTKEVHLFGNYTDITKDDDTVPSSLADAISYLSDLFIDIVKLKGEVNQSNSTSIALLADEVFTGEATNILDSAIIFVNVYSDVASATDGLVILQSSDNIHWEDHDDVYTVPADKGKNYSINPYGKYLKVKYTNGSVDQGVGNFRLQTIVKSTNCKPSSHRIKDTIISDDDAELNQVVIKVQTNDPETYKNVDVQNPLPTDGDSIYGKDLDLTRSSLSAGWTGEVSDLFTDSYTTIVNDSANNPKTITLTFKRPFQTNILGFTTSSGDFSNTKIEAGLLGMPLLTLIDESADSTKKTLLVPPIAPTTLSRMVITFHTTDTVTISSIASSKALQRISRIQALKPDGTTTNIDATAGGNLKVSLEEYETTFITDPLPVRDPILSISRGLLTGTTHINKFGRAPSGIQVTNTDIWDRANAAATQQEWTAPTQSRIHAIVSTSDEDSDTGGTVAQGDGARQLQLYGLTDWDTAEISETIIMDGTTSVNTVNPYAIIYRIEVTNKGSHANGPNVGIITATAATDTTITAQINVSQGQTQMAIVGIPSTQNAYMTQYYLSLHEAGATPSTTLSVDTELLVNPEPDVELTNFLIKQTQGVSNVSTSYLPHNFKPYFEIEGPAIIKLHATSSSADTDVSGGFDIILIDN